MAITRAKKEEILKELSEGIEGSEGMILLSFKGMTFKELSSVRELVKADGDTLRVVKNTLLTRAFDALEIKDLGKNLVDPTAILIVRSDFSATAKIIKQSVSKLDSLDVKEGYFNGLALTKADVLKIADLPSREELYAKALSSLNAPASNFVSLLSNIPRGLVNVLNALKDKKTGE